MNKRYNRLILLLIVGASIVTSAVSTVRSGDDFIIQNADASNIFSTTSSSTLNNLLANVLSRFVIQYANGNQVYDLTASTALNNLVANVSSRFVVQYANANQFYDLAVAPAALQSLLGQVQPRFVIEYANANQNIGLAHPTELINDNTPPQTSDINVSTFGEDSAAITWTTDEFADSTVQYGTQSGNYTETVSDPLYVKNHQIVLTGLVPETTYYYIVSSVDPSGNTVTSIEYSFEMQSEVLVYLPMVTR